MNRWKTNDHDVEVGEQIVTSHISDKYLQGLLIGYVSEINVDANNLTRSGYITPVVDFKNSAGGACHYNDKGGNDRNRSE